jgi:hypothetical protein
MRLLALSVAVVLTALSVGPAPAAEEKVGYEVHHGYLVKTKHYLDARLADKTNFGTFFAWAFTDQEAIDKAFGKAEGRPDPNELMPSGDERARPNLLAKGAFDKKMVIALVRVGNRAYQYRVTGVTADGGTLYVRYQAASTIVGNNTLACPLIVSVEKAKYTSVVFVENGKRLIAADVPQEAPKEK